MYPQYRWCGSTMLMQDEARAGRAPRTKTRAAGAQRFLQPDSGRTAGKAFIQVAGEVTRMDLPLTEEDAISDELPAVEEGSHDEL